MVKSDLSAKRIKQRVKIFLRILDLRAVKPRKPDLIVKCKASAARKLHSAEGTQQPNGKHRESNLPHDITVLVGKRYMTVKKINKHLLVFRLTQAH